MKSANLRTVLNLSTGNKWDCPLEQITSKSKKEITACIEKWVCHDFLQNIASAD